MTRLLDLPWTGGLTKPAADDYVDSILALKLSNGAVAWADPTVNGDLWTFVTPTGPDFDFGAGPSLFTTTNPATGRPEQLVGAGQKSGAGRFGIAPVEGGTRGATGGRVVALETVQVEMKHDNGRPRFVEIPGTENVFPADLVLLAMGFVGPEKHGMLEQFGVKFDALGNVAADAERRCNVSKVFAAGDMRRGQSLVVWAISEGRKAAASVNEYLSAKDEKRPRLRQAVSAR